MSMILLAAAVLFGVGGAAVLLSATSDSESRVVRIVVGILGLLVAAGITGAAVIIVMRMR